MKCFCLSAACMLLASLLSAAPSNDNFASAYVLTGEFVTATGSNIGATKEPGEPSYSGNPGGKSVWWSWIAPAAGSVVIDTGGSSFDTLLTVFTGPTLATLRLTAVNDDHGSLRTSQVFFNVAAGTAYQISVDGFNAASGEIKLAVTWRPDSIRPPANDRFADRIHLRGTAHLLTAENFLATSEPNEPKHAMEIGGASLWWSWTPPVSGTVSISTHASTFDTLLAVYVGSNLTELVEVASNDDADPPQTDSAVLFHASADTPYAIAVDGFNGAIGHLQLRILMSDIIWLDSPKMEDGAVKIDLGAAPGQRVILEESSDLSNWRQVQIITSTDGKPLFIDSAGALLPHRFYRAQLAQD
jgi:hypothetical protein